MSGINGDPTEFDNKRPDGSQCPLDMGALGVDSFFLGGWQKLNIHSAKLP